MTARRIAGVLLDADDTIYDTRAAMHAAGAVAARAVWPHADSTLVARAGVRFRDDPTGSFAAYTRGEVEFEAMRRLRILDLATWLGQEADTVSTALFLDAYEPAFRSHLRAFPDVIPLLDTLQEAGLPVGILTNSAADYTSVKMAATGLADRFTVVCTRDTLGFGKPDARAFHEACARLGTDPAATLHVGDEWVPDPWGAHQAGMPSAWLVRADGDPVGESGAADRLLLAERRAEARAKGIPVIGSLLEVGALVLSTGT